MSLRPGDTLAHYRLLEPIGKGGMGEVWKASDTTLAREVAIKLLPSEFASDPERLARFEREARVLASLNHPGIAQIYGFHEDGGHHFLAMELVSGEDLAVRLDRGPLPVEDALQIARQVAEALEEAHEHGVVHRDLKPANIVLGSEGEAKVLDFGLAKMGAAMSSPSGDLSLSPTITSLGTQVGAIVGTAGYMSPEQARGKAFDRRTDIWAFGCVLFESLSGRRLFGGETISDTIALILQSQPDWALLPAGTPPRLVELIKRCLDKAPRRRLRDIGDARVEIEMMIEGRAWEAGPEVTSAAQSPTKSRLPLFVAALVLGVAVGVAGWSFFKESPDLVSAPVRLSMFPPDGIVPRTVAMTPDGRTVVFSGVANDPEPGSPAPGRLYVRPLDDSEAVPVAGTDGFVTWGLSPDSRWLAYVVPVKPGAVQTRLFKVPIDGSAPPLALADWVEGWSAQFQWIDADRLVVATSQPVALRIIRTDGSGVGEPLLLEVDEDVRGLSLSDPMPDGIHVLADSPTWDELGYHDRIYAVNIETGAVRKLLNEGSNPKWSPTGHLLYSKLEILLAQPMDANTLEFTGGPTPLVDGVRTGAGDYGADFGVSASGTLIYQSGGRIGSRRRLVRFEDTSKVEGWSDDRMSFVGGLTASPDGRYLAVTVMKPDELLYTVWISELERPRLRQFVRMPGLDCNEPSWHPRGVAAHCEGETDRAGIYLAPLDGSQPQFLLRSGGGASMTLQSVHPDGDRILVGGPAEDGRTTLDVAIEATGGPFEGKPLLSSDPTAAAAKFSPDGKAVAYLSRAAGRTDIMLAPYRKDRGLGTPILVATAPTEWVNWIRTERSGVYTLAFTRTPSRVDAVEVRTDSFTVTDPRPFLDTTPIRPQLIDWERLPDGTYLAIQQDVQNVGDRRIELVLNFHEELSRLAD